MKLRYFYIILSTLALFVVTNLLNEQVVQAQMIPISTSGLELSLSDDNPTPGKSVTITANSYVTDINAATIIWTVNGTVMKQGVGQTVFVIQSPAMGKTININVAAVSPSGQHFYNSVSLHSSSIDMIIESEGYVPPFFKGRLPVVHQNTIRIIAVPHLADSTGKEYDPSTLVYKWQRAGIEVLTEQSGYGKNAISLKGSVIPRPYNINVSVHTKDGKSSTEGTILVDPQSPDIAFYINDPLYGPLYNKAVTDANIGTQKETSVVAVPYGFDKMLNQLGALVLNWTINGTEHNELNSSNVITLRAPENSSGTSEVNLSIENHNEILQRASSGFTAKFSGKSSSSDTTTDNQVTF